MDISHSYGDQDKDSPASEKGPSCAQAKRAFKKDQEMAQWYLDCMMPQI